MKQHIPVDIGLSESARLKISQGLSHLLADTYTLYLKTHHFHWNVTGPHFNSLHLMFEGQYTEMALAVDLVAERIRALGAFAPGSYKQFAKLTSIEEEVSVPIWQEMVKQLAEGHQAVVKTARKLLPIVGENDDEGTGDLLTQRIALHEKTAWMLRSLFDAV
jgi:starvation-inducible DNA-binding protein